MTNKTITLDPAVAERLVSAVDNGALFRPGDLEALRAALAEPLPPAGGDAEKLPERRQNFSVLLGDSYDPFMKGQNIGWNFACDAWEPHVTRLQAEVERLAAQKADAVAVVDETDDGLFIDIIYGDDGSSLRRGDKLYTSPPDRGYVSRLAYESLQSELTKARELLSSISNWLVCEAIATPEDMAQSFRPFREEIDAFLFNQSAPADKGTPDDCAHSEANNRGCPECGKEFKCAPALIKTLHANGDRIAMEATIAQQAQRIADLEAGKGQGEPVAEIVSKFGDPEAFGERELIALKDISKFPYGTKLYAEQPAPVAVVMPERAFEDYLDSVGTYFGKGWNACLDEVANLNGTQP